jgi:hypothetical protein
MPNFFHSREESRAIHSQARDSTIGTAHASFACGKCPNDLIALLAFIFVNNSAFVGSRTCRFSNDLLDLMRVGVWGLFAIRF